MLKSELSPDLRGVSLSIGLTQAIQNLIEETPVPCQFDVVFWSAPYEDRAAETVAAKTARVANATPLISFCSVASVLQAFFVSDGYGRLFHPRSLTNEDK
ncbi:MAG: hypothetical protein AB7U63_07405 [Porticoccaceae bacterium]